MPMVSRICRSSQVLGALMAGVLLVACASPQPAPARADHSAKPSMTPQPAAPVAVASVSAAAPAAMAVTPAAAAASTEAAPAPMVAVPEPTQPAMADQAIAQGLASWYGPKFHGRRTASGERYDMYGLSAAHRTLPFGTRLRVRSVATGKEVVVRINDRGPYKRSRIIDLSLGAITALGLRHRGVTEVILLRE